MTDRARPADQRRRIATLRAAVLGLGGLLLMTRSAWPDGSLPYEILEPLGALLVIVSVLGRAWAMLYIGGRKNGVVMQDGPYSVCRHPLYLFSTVAAAGFGALLGSVVLTLGIGALTYAILIRTARREEAFLRAEFPGTYEPSAARVPAILPAPSLFRTAPEITVNVHSLRRNMGDALVFLAFIPLAEAIEGLHRVLPWGKLGVW